MKIWINEHIKKAKFVKQNFDRDGQKCALLTISFKNNSLLNIYLTKNDLKTILKQLPRE